MPELLPSHGTDGIHAESCLRDQHFVMQGHHCHSCVELFCVESGSCRFLLDEHIFDLREGDLILVPPMVLHYTRYVFGACRRTVIFFREEDLDPEVRRSVPQGALRLSEATVMRIPPAHRERILELLRALTEEEGAADCRTALLRKAYLQTLLLLCGRVCGFLKKPSAALPAADPQVLQAVRYICRHYAEPLTSEDVARAVAFSPNYLSRKFRLSTGIGLHEYIVFVRLQHAAQELAATSDSITAIALRCGFSDSNYFKESFKKKYGVTPRGYRKASAQKAPAREP